MEFDQNLTHKILDPIHGIIRLSELELQFVAHPLFQRLRSIKQNTFLYKVFPSAMHSRFEHSLGVMHLSYEIIKNLKLNTYRYHADNADKPPFLYDINNLSTENIQELRLAALLHDIGHGPMSHQFDSFICEKKDLKKHLEKCDEFKDLNKSYRSDMIKMIDGDLNIEHEHISLIFVKIIYDGLEQKLKISIDIDKVMMIIESKYRKGTTINNDKDANNVRPLLTSVISSSPIDADRMDYLLRDSYFSGVKCGVYDLNRLFMSIVPVTEKNEIFIAYKESALEPIVEFINSRSSLYGQVYYHKTNRAFCAMLKKTICDDNIKTKLLNFKGSNDDLKPLEGFYIQNSDEYFLRRTLPKHLSGNEDAQSIIDAKSIIDAITRRAPWSKVYESKLYTTNLTIDDEVNTQFTKGLKEKLDKYTFAIDIMTDNAFKGITNSKIKLLTKTRYGVEEIKAFSKTNKLDKNQSIKYLIRIFVDKSAEEKLAKDNQKLKKSLIDKIQNIKLSLIGEYNKKEKRKLIEE